MVVHSLKIRNGERIRKIEALIGMVLVGPYPEHNFDNVRTGYEVRRVLVESVKDTRKEPLEPETIVADPNRVRSRFLLTCRDLDKGKVRHFYLGRFKSWSVHRATPAIIFPQLEYDIVRCGEERRRCVSDPRGLFARHYLEDFADAIVLPASSPVVFG